jgi:hypothetical protein
MSTVSRIFRRPRRLVSHARPKFLVIGGVLRANPTFDSGGWYAVTSKRLNRFVRERELDEPNLTVAVLDGKHMVEIDGPIAFGCVLVTTAGAYPTSEIVSVDRITVEVLP